MIKKCSSCGVEKNIEQFHNSKKNLDGKANVCKECRSKINKKSYIKNYDKYREKWNIQNKKRKEHKSEWYKQNKKENYKKYKEKWDIQNKNRKESKALWFQENKERIIQENLTKRKENLKLQISHLISSGILKSLKSQKNGRKWENLVGYSLDVLMNHLFKDFDINEYNPKKYHIDHIIPVDAYYYDSYEDEEFKKCWSYRNLRLIKAEENLKKSNSIDKEIILEYNIIDLLPKEVVFEDL